MTSPLEQYDVPDTPQERTDDETFQIPLCRIQADPSQARKSFRDIEGLAQSISQHGLLENLVVDPLGNTGNYRLVAGERRYRALQKLKWEYARCIIRTGAKARVAALVENIQRDALPPWRVGLALAELHASGMTIPQLYEQTGKPPAYLTQRMQLGRRLHPSIITKLERLPPHTFTLVQLMRLSSHINPDTGEPDEQAQTAVLNKYLATPRHNSNRSKRVTRDIVFQRFHRLRTIRADPPASYVLEAIIEFLEGQSPRLKLPNLFRLRRQTAGRRTRKEE